MSHILILIVVAAVCGSVASAIVGKKSGGCTTRIFIGFIGAVLGSWLSKKFEIADLFYIRQIPIIWSVIGSTLFILLISLIIDRD